MNLLTLNPITTAIASGTITPAVRFNAPPTNLAVQGNFVYGSSGTSVDAYLQTSLDNGTTWIDIANFHFTTSSLRAMFNPNSQTPVTTQYTATDGSITGNTSKDGILGLLYRVKYTSSGTYAGGTTLSIDIATNQAPN